jgi:hypothetical protein
MKVTKKNWINEEIKSRSNSDDSCYHSVHNLLSCLLSKNVRLRIYKATVLPMVLYGCEPWSLAVREEHRLRVFENRVFEENIWTEER